MLVHISFPIIDRPTGGGNQFLRALRKQFREWNVYAEHPADSNVVLFNSHAFGHAARFYRDIVRLKRLKKHDLVVVHRVDGPVSVVRGSSRDIVVDNSIFLFNSRVADATVFQSSWSCSVCEIFGVGVNQPSTIIANAPDGNLFYPERGSQYSGERKIRIMASSWSSNWRKGFDIYRYLDRHLDFNRYEMTFAGNSPIVFHNIHKVDPLPSEELADLLRKHHIYLTASVDDPCSNALIEALHCGLPSVVRKSGGHPELIGNGGVIFDGTYDVLAAIDRCSTSLNSYRNQIDLPSMEKVARKYLDFFETTWGSSQNGLPPAKIAPNLIQTSRLLGSVSIQRFGPTISRRLSSALCIREALFYRDMRPFRSAPWGPDPAHNWTETDARHWLEGVFNRLPLFLDSMRHVRVPNLYRYSFSGDRQKQPSLGSSVFVAKIRYLTGFLDQDERNALSQHILSYQQPNGAITDPWIAKHSRWQRLITAARSQNCGNIDNKETIRAETRQSFAALRCLDEKPSLPFSEIPQTSQAIDSCISALDWSHPWGAGSHISHLAFFMKHHSFWFPQTAQPEVTAEDMLAEVHERYRQDDGAWYLSGAPVSLTERVNGAMQMVTALDAAGIKTLEAPEGLIDLCLSVVNGGHACNHFNVICVLHRCHQLTKYMRREIHAYCLDRLQRYREHYWPWQGGFSFYHTAANDVYYGARVSTGMAEPDVHGTLLILWGIVLIADILGWKDDYGLKRPWN